VSAVAVCRKTRRLFGARLAIIRRVRSRWSDIVLWKRKDDDVHCVASRRALASRWEVRIVRKSIVLRRHAFRCFVRAARTADAWRVEFDGHRA
jgi:hypothetical protein